MVFVKGPDLRQRDPGRRDQPHAAQDPGRAAGGDAGAPGDRGRGAATRWSEPFFVLATQNPIEMEGTYPLPEAQLDRFMFNVIIDYLPEDDEVAVVQATTAQEPRRLEPAVHGRGRAAVPRGGAGGADRRGGRSATPCGWRRRRRPRPGGHARVRQRVGELGRRACGRRSTWCWGPRPGRCSRGGSTSRPTTSGRWPRRCCATGSCSATAPRPRRDRRDR